MQLESDRQVFEKFACIKFNFKKKKALPFGAELLQTDRQTDRQRYMITLTVAFHSSGKLNHERRKWKSVCVRVSDCVYMYTCVCECVHACARGPVSTPSFLPTSELHETQYDIHHHHHVTIMGLGRLLTCSGLMHPVASSTVLPDSSCLTVQHYDTFITFNM